MVEDVLVSEELEDSEVEVLEVVVADEVPSLVLITEVLVDRLAVVGSTFVRDRVCSSGRWKHTSTCFFVRGTWLSTG